MTDAPFAWPHDPQPNSIAAGDPGLGAPDEAPGFGEDIEHDVFPEGDGETLEDELRDRPAPPFRTPHPEHET